MTFNRRDFLKAVTAGSWLAATGSSLAADAAPRSHSVLQEANVVWMMDAADFSDEAVDQFEEQNPGITLTRIDDDPIRLFEMLAAGEPPDTWSVQYPQFPQLLARDLVLNLQAYFDASSVIVDDDLVTPNNYYRATDAFNIGAGARYGMMKDWSPDMTMFVNDALFEAAGVGLVSSTEPSSYPAWAAFASQVKQLDSGSAPVIGMFMNTADWADRYWEAWLQPLGNSLYRPGFADVNIIHNDEARALIQYHLDLVRELTIPGPDLTLNTGACGDMIAGRLAIAQAGYGFGACLRQNTGDNSDFQALMAAGKIRMVPAPTWGDVRSSPTITAPAIVVSSSTSNPDAVWKAYQYYMAEEPAQARAAAGLGAPALQSLYALLPRDGVYNQLTYAALIAEQAFASTIIRANPFLVGDEPGVVSRAFNQNLESYLDGAISFDDLLFIMESEARFAIQEGRDLIG